MFQYQFTVPEQKRVRVIVYTDCKNEADDQFALAHHLMTPKFDVVGIIAGHFEKNPQQYGTGNTMQASFDEIHKVLGLMGLDGAYKVLKGATKALPDEATPVPSEASAFIMEEALKDDPRPLYIACQGGITDLASAILENPEICPRMTAIWIGGGKWPGGGFEFNLMQDINAGNVLFASQMPVWQIPINVYKQIAVSLAELQVRVAPCGELGKYLFEQMVAFNTKTAHIAHWPHGESWGLGDQGTVTVLMEESERMNWDAHPAPRILPDMTYRHGTGYRNIRVYHTLDSRFTLEDLYAKLTINFPAKSREADD